MTCNGKILLPYVISPTLATNVGRIMFFLWRKTVVEIVSKDFGVHIAMLNVSTVELVIVSVFSAAFVCAGR